MAAEYSRELGVKVFAGKVRLARSGFRMGGKPGYGVRRMMLSGTGEPKGLIGTGDMKSYSRDRVVLVPGPRQEQEVIKKIYSLMFEGVRCKKIAERLNSEKVPFLDGRQWHYWSVLEVLRNPKYAGINAWGRSNQRLYGPTQKLPREKWITCEGAFAPIIPPRTYWQMQQLLDNKRIYTDQQMLDGLRKVWKIHGNISRTLIRLTKDVPCETQYYRRFGTLENAYRQIGYVQVQREFNGPEHRILSEQLRDRLAGKVERASGGRVQLVRRNLKLRPVLVVDGRIKVDVLVCPYRYTCDQVDRWFFYPHERSEKTHLTIAVLIAQENRRVHRVYLVPSDIGRHRFRLSNFERLGIRLRNLHEIAQQCWDAKLAGAYRQSSELSV
jgi:hypothetical protein